MAKTIKAKHYLFEEYKSHPGSERTDGNPSGFYRGYGPTTIYNRKEGSRPFDELLASITNMNNTTLVGVGPGSAPPSVAKPSNADYVPPHLRIPVKRKTHPRISNMEVPSSVGT